MTYEIKAQPTDLKKVDDQHIAVSFADGKTFAYPMDWLRSKCPCAKCIDEWTGKLLVHYEDVRGVTVKRMEQVGTYAFSIAFSDGHSTGIFTYKRMREWGEELAARSAGL